MYIVLNSHRKSSLLGQEHNYNNSIFTHSEGARQQLESMRGDRRHRAAVLIQATWRGWHLRRRWPALRRTLELQLVRPATATLGNSNSKTATNSG